MLEGSIITLNIKAMCIVSASATFRTMEQFSYLFKACQKVRVRLSQDSLASHSLIYVPFLCFLSAMQKSTGVTRSSNNPPVLSKSDREFWWDWVGLSKKDNLRVNLSVCAQSHWVYQLKYSRTVQRRNYSEKILSITPSFRIFVHPLTITLKLMPAVLFVHNLHKI